MRIQTHKIKPGKNVEINPLKGLIPYQEDKVNFPHSMEWFSLPVNSVQTGMNTFDWAALEEKLETVAVKGCQAVFRFYYDYPGLATGVPQFLIDKGLGMREYNEPEALGGRGLCPDYADEELRRSMINFIRALGKNYDGDPRIGFISEGLLGFWGEWHTWPFDGRTAGDRPNWSIPAEVYEEVYGAFEEAFHITLLCVREPKAGVTNARYRTGYHDDSFGYATLPVKKGGQTWSFVQRLQDFMQNEKWKKNCIGGEVYPPIQDEIFKRKPKYPDYIDKKGRQNWNKCVAEAHPTWLLCGKIKSYQDEVRERAIEASKQLGYEFQVVEASFRELIDEDPVTLQVRIRNIGVAPFYYDHTLWKVLIGFKNEDGSVAFQTTRWDLNAVQADGKTVCFWHTLEEQDLKPGAYTLCMKVANPLPGGMTVWFANRDQTKDGWLPLGTVRVKGYGNS